MSVLSRSLGGYQSRSGGFGEEKNFSALSRIKRPATGLVTIVTEVSQLPVLEIYCTACEGSLQLNTAMHLPWLIVELTLELSETDHEVNADLH